MSDRNPLPLPAPGIYDVFESDDVRAYLSQDMYGRWVWRVSFYTIGAIGALTLTKERTDGVLHLRHNLRRMAAALTKLAEDVK